MTPPTTNLTITVDTVAPATESGGTPSLDPAVQINGTDIKLYFTESLQTAANAGALNIGFTINGENGGLGTVGSSNIAATLGYHTQQGNNDLITLSGFGTIAEGEDVSISYSSNIKDLAWKCLSPSGTISLTNLTNSSPQPSGSYTRI